MRCECKYNNKKQKKVFSLVTSPLDEKKKSDNFSYAKMKEKCKRVDIIIIILSIYLVMPSNCNSYTDDGVCKVDLKGEGGENERNI